MRSFAKYFNILLRSFIIQDTILISEISTLLERCLTFVFWVLFIKKLWMVFKKSTIFERRQYLNVDLWVLYVQNFERCSTCSQYLNIDNIWMWTTFEGREYLNVDNILMCPIFQCPQCLNVFHLPPSPFFNFRIHLLEFCDIFFAWGRGGRLGEGCGGPCVAHTCGFSDQCSQVYNLFWSSLVVFSFVFIGVFCVSI